jgi:C4-dicarboxylate-specific signal transduction histidine kinase
VDATYLADFRQLRHWGIAENLMPEGSEVRYKEVTTWERYRWQILTALSVILVQAVLIGVLMIHRRRLHQTQYELHDEYERRRKAETAVLRVRTKLSRFSKQSSLGVMATAIAHEINQPLIAVQNYVLAARQRLRGDVDQSAKLEELLEKAGQQAGRVGEIIQRIRNLVTRDTPNLRPVLLISVIEQAIRIMEAEIENSGCEVKFRLPENLPPILADELQIQLVLINLLRNALRAVKNLEDSAERIIRIQVSRMSDRNVQVDVVDRGPGIAPARVAEIFAPLYTEMGDGMGMGLAVCQLVIEAHGGRIWYEPNPSGGAILSFTLRVEKGGQG